MNSAVIMLHEVSPFVETNVLLYYLFAVDMHGQECVFVHDVCGVLIEVDVRESGGRHKGGYHSSSVDA